jgi:hypothetical protein
MDITEEKDLEDKEIYNALMKESQAEDLALLDAYVESTQEEIKTAIKVIKRINYKAAYGRNPKLCGATCDTIYALEGMIPEIVAQREAGAEAVKKYIDNMFKYPIH